MDRHRDHTMEFLNSIPKLDETITLDYSFYLAGKPSIPKQQIIEILRSGKFPTNIKGNFAFYFKDANRIVVAVDHLPNYNMFYCDSFCSHIYIPVQQTRRKLGKPVTDNIKIKIQIGMFWGGSVGEETTRNEIKRIPAAHYLEVLPDGSKKLIEYRNIYEHEVAENYSILELSDIVESYIKDHAKDNFALLQSSGTDSSTILGYFRKLGIEHDAKYISLKGDKEHASEHPHIQRLADYYGTTVNWFNVGEYAGRNEQIMQNLEQDDPLFFSAYHRTYSAFWTEPHVMLKYKAIKDLGFGDHTVFTGEVGDQIFGSRFGKILLKYIIQNPTADVEQIAQLFLNCDASRFSYAGISTDYTKVFALPPVQRANDAAKEWFIKTWNKVQTDDLVNKIELMQYLYKGSHRVYNYNQFPDVKFAHPFADSEVFDYVWKIPGHLKLGDGGRSRMLSYELVKDYMVDWPWRMAKTGVAVLSRDKKFDQIKGIYDRVQMVLGKYSG